MAKVLVGCEFSGRVRDAILDNGHDAVSCDLVPSESLRGPHIQGDVRDALRSESWDAAILHPSCRFTALSGNGTYAGSAERAEALEFQRDLWAMAPERAALEQPRSVSVQVLGPPTQKVHPWQHGHGEKKETWLWLRGLAPLEPTQIVDGREPRVHHMSKRGGAAYRTRRRSRTYPGIARAMADQWFPRTTLESGV